MEPIGAAAIYDIAGAPGELLLALLIAFGLGALFGRAILTPPRLTLKQPHLFAPKKKPVSQKESASAEPVIITPAPRSSNS